MAWDRAGLIERVVSCQQINREYNFQKKKVLHVFVPWNTSEVEDLMFQFKTKLNNQGACLIPYMEKDLSLANMSRDEKLILIDQLNNGIETHLYMSNLDSIHVWKIKKIVSNDEINKDLIVPSFQEKKHFTVWFEIEDLYVLQANHGSDGIETIEELDKLGEMLQIQNLFSPVQQLRLDSQLIVKTEAFKWIDVNRAVTYDYFIRSCELEDNIYQNSWKDLARATQHYLIVGEQTRHKAILYRNEEKLLLLKESFENYLSAIMNELNEIYVKPFMNVLHAHECMQEAWCEIQSNFINPKLQKIVNEMLTSESNQIVNLTTFLDYMQNAKSVLFSLKSKFTKKISKEEYLQIESFLARQESIVESFLSKGLVKKIQAIMEVKNWLQAILDEVSQMSSAEKKDHTLKITHLLMLLSSANYDDNLFFKILEEKTSKGVTRRSFDEEVKNLMNKSQKYAA